jgi:O-antigen/teichoic acid export membrane protein
MWRIWRNFSSRDIPAQITLANLIAMALSFAAVPLIARGVGPAGRGETGAAIAVFAIAPVLLAAGMPLEIRRRSVGAIPHDWIRAARDIAAVSIVPAAALAFAVTMLIFSTSPTQVQWLVFAGVTLAPMGVVWSVDTAVLVGAGRYRAVAIMRLVQPTFTLLVIATLWALDQLTRELVLIPYVIGSLLTTAAGMRMVRVRLRGQRASRRALVRRGANFAGSAIAEAASARLDQILVLPVIGATAAGLYSIAAAMAALLTAVGQALGADVFRDSVRAGSEESDRQIAVGGLGEGVSVVTPAGLALGIGSVWAIPLVFGTDYRASVDLLWWLLPGGISFSVGFIGSMLLAANARGRDMTLLQALSLALGVALLYVLGPLLGPTGAAIASSLSGLALLVGQTIALKIPPSRLVPRWSSAKAGVRRILAR